MQGKVNLLILLLFLSSCSDSKLVLKMYNKIVTEFKSKGTKIYPGKVFEITLDGYYCTLESRFERLNALVPNPSYDSSLCKFFIDYQYIESMREYVRNKSPKRIEKLDVLSKEEYYKLNRYYDSLWLIQMDSVPSDKK